MFFKSIRWRLQLWLAFLLVCVLSGFGVTIYQLQRVSQLRQIDEELERRVAVLSGAVRGGPPPKRSFAPPPFERGPGPRDFDKDNRHPPPPEGRPPFRGERKGLSDLAISRFRRRSQACLTKAVQALSTSRSGPAMALCSSGQATRLPMSLCRNG